MSVILKWNRFGIRIGGAFLIPNLAASTNNLLGLSKTHQRIVVSSWVGHSINTETAYVYY